MTGTPAERAILLSMLVDDEVIEILKKRLSAEERADLVMEMINHHRPLTTAARARLAGKDVRTIQRRGGVK